MSKYRNVFKQAIKNAVAYLFAYRSDFTLKLFLGAGWSITWIAFIDIFFAHTSSFNGWTRTDVFLIIFSFQFVEFVGILGNNLNSLESDIRHGTFDFVVTKPIDSQFFVTFSKPDLTNLIFFISYQIPLLCILIKNQIPIIPSHIPLYLFLLLCATLTWLAITTLCVAINFWKQRLDNLQGTVWAVLEFGRYPVSIFPKNLRLLFYTFFPAAFMGFIPASYLLGRSPASVAIPAFFITVSFLTISRIVWKRAVKKYSSASS